MSSKTLIALFLTITILSANAVPTFAQNSAINLQNLVVKMDLAPSHVDEKNSNHSIGYVNLVTKTGIPIKASNDIFIELESDNPAIASVPSQVIIPHGKNHAVFDVKTGSVNGETTITSVFQNQIDSEKIRVGGTDNSLPDDIRLKINLPSNKMHVNSQMPFSVLLETSDEEIIRAPFDIEIVIDYEDSLLTSNTESLVIKKGEYYAWGELNTNELIGNAFLRATYSHFGIDTAENIEISSSLPVALNIHVFPNKVSADVERYVDVFVSLVDSEGLPAITPEDVQLELFSDKDSIGNKLDERMKSQKVLIKKGEFGYYFREKVDLTDYLDSSVTIGASAEDLGIALGKVTPVRPLNINSHFAENKTMNLFIPPQIPSNTTAILVYQISALGHENVEEEEVFCSTDDEEKGLCEPVEVDIEHPIQVLDFDELYPVQANENYQASGTVDKLNIISSDKSIINIDNLGSIESTRSYGTAMISSGQKNGEVTLAATLKGIGAGTTTTEVIDVFKHVETKIFSPTGDDKIVLDKNGYFDLFLVALDGKDRPKILETQTRYIVSPVNEIIEIEKNNSFAYANVHSDSFDAGTDEIIDVSAVPIGVNAEIELESTTTFDTQVSSLVDVVLPFESLDAESEDNYNGIVRLTDLLGNPSKASKDLKINLVLDGQGIVDVPDQVTISEGTSYVTFPITPLGETGDAVISASVKGVIGTDTKISTASNLPVLQIFANGVQTPIEPGEPIQLKVFVDDEYAESVPGASVRFVTNGGVSITPEETRTTTDGSATVDLTAEKGPNISIEIIATAEGYLEGKKTFDYQVNDFGAESFALGLPEWVVYVGLAAMIGIVAIIVVFLKKPKPEYDEDEEYEYEYEEEI